MGPSVLVLGGAGFIGSHMTKMLVAEGCQVTVMDNLSTGNRNAVRRATFVEDDLANPAAIERMFNANHFDVVMHFAACCYVGESVRDPSKYYKNNVIGTLLLLEAMRRADVRHLVFSSSCATYGVPVSLPIAEDHPQKPVNPYGMSKYVCERAIEDYTRAYGLRAVCLRYFNAAGCDPDGELGEQHEPETHLIPLVLMEANRVRRGGDPEQTGLEVFGADFATRDGTCIRDYVHVCDICDAHLRAMCRLLEKKSGGFEAFNLGAERGATVKEVIKSCAEVSGTDIRYREVGRRPGDPAELVASAQKAQAILGWIPKFRDLGAIIDTAWKWSLASKRT